MKYLLILSCLLFTSVGWSEDVCMDYLEDRDGLFYEKFMDAPFTGQYLSCYENGQQLKVKSHYKDGKYEGEFIRYYEDGQLNIKSNFKDGKYDGEFLRYYKDGQLNIKSNFKDGKYDGKFLRYYESGQLSEKGNFKDGKPEGEQLSYHGNGKLKKTEIYKDGKLIEIIKPWEHHPPKSSQRIIYLKVDKIVRHF